MRTGIIETELKSAILDFGDEQLLLGFRQMAQTLQEPFRNLLTGLFALFASDSHDKVIKYY